MALATKESLVKSPYAVLSVGRLDPKDVGLDTSVTTAEVYGFESLEIATVFYTEDLPGITVDYLASDGPQEWVANVLVNDTATMKVAEVVVLTSQQSKAAKAKAEAWAAEIQGDPASLLVPEPTAEEVEAAKAKKSVAPQVVKKSATAAPDAGKVRVRRQSAAAAAVAAVEADKDGDTPAVEEAVVKVAPRRKKTVVT